MLPLGKLSVPAGLEQEIGWRGLQELPLHYRHGECMTRLPPHHQEPFDRMLIAQALVENLVLITRDGKFQIYPGLKLLMT